MPGPREGELGAESQVVPAFLLAGVPWPALFSEHVGWTTLGRGWTLCTVRVSLSPTAVPCLPHFTSWGNQGSGSQGAFPRGQAAGPDLTPLWG